MWAGTIPANTQFILIGTPCFGAQVTSYLSYYKSQKYKFTLTLPAIVCSTQNECASFSHFSYATAKTYMALSKR